MKIKVIQIDPRGKSPEDVAKMIQEIVEAETKKVQKVGTNPVEEDGDDCTCSVCELRRELEASLREREQTQEKQDSEDEVSSPFIDDKQHTFSEALDALRNDYRVARGSWPAVMSLELLTENPDGECEPHIAQMYNDIDNIDELYYLATYNFSQEDILATDWKIFKQ